MVSQLNYDEVMSRTTPGEQLGQNLEILMNEEVDDKEEEKMSNRLSSSRYEEDDDNPINPIKDFNTKTSRIFADSESIKLNSSMTSQKSFDPFMVTNSSVMTTYLYKPGTNSNQGDHSNSSSQAPSPSKRSSITSNRTSGASNPSNGTKNLAEGKVC